MRPALLCSFALIALAPATARAQRAPAPAMELAYTLGDGAGDCPGEELLHRELARRVGYDPFVPGPPGAPPARVRVVIARGPRGLTATCDHRDAVGAHGWTRTYPVEGDGARACEAAVEGIAVDLQVELPLFRTPRPSAPSAPPPPSIAAPPAPPPPAAPRPRLEIGGGAFVAAGISPAATLGGAVHLGVEVSPFGRARHRLSFAIEGRADATATGARGVQTSLLAGAVVACGHEDLFTAPTGVTWAALGCLVGAVGRVHGWTPGVESPVSLGATYAGVGPRFGIEARLAARAAVRLQGDVLPTAHAARLVVDARGEAWRTADVTGNGGLAVVLFF
jgi:hypothetical protein